VHVLDAAEKPAPKPNILFILADDLGSADTVPPGALGLMKLRTSRATQDAG
ncbi:MAG: hypothetical protein RLZZ142_1930, partial [Verrucomicrobiota bacterium]